MTASLLAVALAAAAAADYQALLDRYRAEQDVPGVSAVVTHRDAVLFAGASGLADLETARAMTQDTVLYAGSLTKILTATLTLQLVEENRLSLDDVVARIPHGPVPRDVDVTVFHLLTHTSGLDREGDFGYWFSADFPDAAGLDHYVFGAELRGPPGAAVHYSNVGYAALGPVIERATGRPFSDALHTRVLQPLGMGSTGSPGPGPGIATGYTPPGRMLPDEDRPFAGVSRQVGERRVREYHEANAMTPAFGAYTSASDYGRLARFLLGYGDDAVLSDGMRSRMLTRQAGGRGLGFRVGRLDGHRVARHDGWFAAHRSHLLLDLDADIGIVVLANSDNAAPAKIAEALVTLARRAEVGNAP